MKEPLKHISIALGVLILLAIFPLPYGYYTFLRLTVFIGGLFLAYCFYQRRNVSLVLILVSIVILFNPFIPIYLTREIWLAIDLICAGSFFCIRKLISGG